MPFSKEENYFEKEKDVSSLISVSNMMMIISSCI